jgi:FkbM family methyltransferase
MRTKTPFWRRALRIAGLKAFHFSENNENSHSSRNGEAWLVRKVVECGIRRRAEALVVFDVGSNVGDYTRLVLLEAGRAHCPVHVHAFEPSPHNAEILQRVFANEPTVQMTCAAAGEEPGEAILYSGRSGSSQASLVKRSNLPEATTGEISVPVLRLDQYMQTRGIERVDLLKLDIEGAELAALQGLGDRLNPKTVDLIQFEYGGTTLDAKVWLRDFYALLSNRGFVIAKLLPHALEVRPYHAWMEHYGYANYLALSPQFLEQVSK